MKVCPSCGKNCSDTEFYCSNCGFPMNNVPVCAELKHNTDAGSPILPPAAGYGQNSYGPYNDQYANPRTNPYHQYMYFSYYPQEIRRKTDPFAITSFAVSLSSIFLLCYNPLSFIGAIVGLVFGILSIRRINNPRKFFSGRGFAITGIIVSSIIMFLCIIGLLFLIFAISSSSYPQAGPSWSL